MKNISIKELNSIICDSSILGGGTIQYGKNVYRIDRLDNGVAWICYLSYEIYRCDFDKYNNSPEGWSALLRIA